MDGIHAEIVGCAGMNFCNSNQGLEKPRNSSLYSFFFGMADGKRQYDQNDWSVTKMLNINLQ